MMGQLIVAGFAMAFGFVAAGMLSSGYQLITATPARFELSQERMVSGLLQVLLLMFAGPVIVMRGGMRACLVERKPIGWLAGATAVAAAWSLCSGVVVMAFALGISSSLT